MGNSSVRMPKGKNTLESYVEGVHVTVLARSIQQELPGMLVISEISHLMSNTAVPLFVAKTSHCVDLRSDQVEIKIS